MNSRIESRKSFVRTLTELNKLENKLDTLLGSKEKAEKAEKFVTSIERTTRMPRTPRTKKLSNILNFMNISKNISKKRSHKKRHDIVKTFQLDEKITFTPVRKINKHK